MKIIHRGMPPGEVMHEGTCNLCYTTVEYAKHEGTASQDQRDGGATYVECPVCKGTIWGRKKEEKPTPYAGRN